MTKETRVKLRGLRRSRRRAKLSIKELAHKASCSNSAVYWAEHGKAVLRTIAVRLANVLKVKLASLQAR